MALDPVAWFIVFIISVTAHEAAHAAAAYLGGDPTAYGGGQVSLNPIPHAQREPFGMLIMPLISVFMVGWPIGWASTPYNPEWERAYPRRAAWMAAAGPTANLLLALIALVLLRWGLSNEMFLAPEATNFGRLVEADSQFIDNFGRFLSMLLMLNLILFLFNLLPVPPLDGVAVITLPMPNDLALRFRETFSNPAFGLIGLLIAWQVFGEVVPWIWDTAVALVHPDIPYR